MATTSHLPKAAPEKGNTMALEKELATFEKKLPEMKAGHEGQFVLIHGDEVIDFFDTYEDAIRRGYSLFKLEPFLVRQVHSVEQALFVSKCIEPETDAVIIK